MQGMVKSCSQYEPMQWICSTLDFIIVRYGSCTTHLHFVHNRKDRNPSLGALRHTQVCKGHCSRLTLGDKGIRSSLPGQQRFLCQLKNIGLKRERDYLVKAFSVLKGYSVLCFVFHFKWVYNAKNGMQYDTMKTMQYKMVQ